MNPRLLKSEYKLLLHAFQSGKKMDAVAASGFLGIAIQNTRRYLTLLHTHHHIYIHHYRKPLRGPLVPVYAYDLLGDAEDAEYTPALTGAELQRRARARAKFLKETQNVRANPDAK